MEYLLVNPEEEIPEEHSIIAWTNFLPPLKRFHIRGLQNISDSFLDLLLRDIRLGSMNQTDKILVIQSKIIEYSFAIQESIQKIVDRKDLLLKNTIHPYMDNACCNEKGAHQLTCLQYFEKDDNNISQNNIIVEKLSNFINDINILTEASIFLSSVDTKRKYTFLPSAFGENTIYQAFIVYCNFNSLMPIQTDLISLCKEKPDIFSVNDSIEEQIEKLKRDGQHYSHTALLRLLQIVSRNNLVNIQLQNETYSQLQPLRDLLSNKLNPDCFSKTFIELMEGIMDTFDISVTSDTEDMRKLKNYLDTSNGKMKKRLLDFIKQKGKIQKTQYKNMETFIQKLSVWEFDNSTTNKISDDAMYNYLQFFKTFIDMVGKVFPTMVLNKQQHTIQPPKYWGLSSRHDSDIIQIVSSYYKPIEQLYGDSKLDNILVEIQRRCKDILLFSKETPAFTEITNNNTTKYSVFDKRTSTLLYEYYLLILFTNYIDLADNPYMIKRDVPTLEDDYESENFIDTLEPNYISGDLNVLKEKTANLLIGYIRIMMESKDIINVSYDTIMDQVFKIKEREKDTFTDRLKEMTDEARNVDTLLKINKLGVWGKGLAKGIKEYDPENYDQERDIMSKIAQIEKRVRKNNPDADERNMDVFVQDYMEEMDADAEEDEERNMDNMLDDFMDGYDYNETEDEDPGHYD